MKRHVKVTCITCGPATMNKKENLNEALRLLDNASEEKPDFIVFNEFFSTPDWFGLPFDEEYFDWSEPIPGPTTNLLAERAKHHKCNIIVPIFENGELEGEYYNSAVVIDAHGNIVNGILPNGKSVTCYRKSHIPFIPAANANEKMYFRPGCGFPAFRINDVTIGILICYDRLFSEAWRVLALQGVEIVFLPSAISGGWWGTAEEKFTLVQRSMALLNQFFIVACNKGGKEVINGHETLYLGKSCIVNPMGELLAQSTEYVGPAVISATLDLEEISKARRRLQLYLDRRPEIYQL